MNLQERGTENRGEEGERVREVAPVWAVTVAVVWILVVFGAYFFTTAKDIYPRVTSLIERLM
jgi:hypothetical protein